MEHSTLKCMGLPCECMERCLTLCMEHSMRLLGALFNAKLPNVGQLQICRRARSPRTWRPRSTSSSPTWRLHRKSSVRIRFSFASLRPSSRRPASTSSCARGMYPHSRYASPMCTLRYNLKPMDCVLRSIFVFEKLADGKEVGKSVGGTRKTCLFQVCFFAFRVLVSTAKF